ncbi:MAG: hypothetical protein J6Y42_01080 [Bacilli bacterium]|nr:hypothetical protein [Bacilli bacterium]
MEDNNKGTGKDVGIVLGGVAGIIGTIMANPIGRWGMFTAQDEAGLAVHHFFEDTFKSRDVGDTAYRVFNAITNTIMAYPAILPIVGGLLSAGIGALIGKKISKSKLKHQSLKTVSKTNTR